MRRWLVGGALCIGGCVDKNPEFVDTMPAGETGMQTSAPPATDSAATDGPATTAPVTTTTTTTTTGTESGDTEDTLEPTGYPVTTEPMSTTMPPGGCGDGKVNPNEECDDGNPDEDDGCLTTCVKASCGDGFVQSEVEACDDGNVEYMVGIGTWGSNSIFYVS